jgi:pyruvate, water dikinase
MTYTARLEDLNMSCAARAGGKGANLGELASAGFPVPRGYVVLSDAYLAAMIDGRIRAEIIDTVNMIEPSGAPLARVAERLKCMVRKAGVPEDVRLEIVDAYRALGPEARVALRSSVVGEDPSGREFAAVNRTLTNVVGEHEVVAMLVECWASLYAGDAIVYRRDLDIVGEPRIAVVVQLMVDAQRTGTMFTSDPMANDHEMIVVEAGYGHGVGTSVLREEQVVALAQLGREIEDHYHEPQAVEWAIANDEVFVLQSQPITALRPVCVSLA